MMTSTPPACSTRTRQLTWYTDSAPRETHQKLEGEVRNDANEERWQDGDQRALASHLVRQNRIHDRV